MTISVTLNFCRISFQQISHIINPRTIRKFLFRSRVQSFSFKSSISPHASHSIEAKIQNAIFFQVGRSRNALVQFSQQSKSLDQERFVTLTWQSELSENQNVWPNNRYKQLTVEVHCPFFRICQSEHLIICQITFNFLAITEGKNLQEKQKKYIKQEIHTVA